jgi:hypothetical protein
VADEAQGNGVTSFRVAAQADFDVVESIFEMIFGQDLGKTGVTIKAAVVTRIGLDESAMASASPFAGYGKNRQSEGQHK